MLNQLNYKSWFKKEVFQILGEERYGTLMTEADAKAIAQIAVDKALNTRSKSNRTTGEWLIFEKSDENEKLLALALHSEDDTEIYKRLVASDLAF